MSGSNYVLVGEDVIAFGSHEEDAFRVRTRPEGLSLPTNVATKVEMCTMCKQSARLERYMTSYATTVRAQANEWVGDAFIDTVR